MNYGYIRVSGRKPTNNNTYAAQEAALKSAGAEKLICDEFNYTNFDRPELEKLLSVVKSGDVIFATTLTVFGNSIRRVNEVVNKVLSKNATLNILNLGIIDNSPASLTVRTLLRNFSETEGDMGATGGNEGRKIALKNNPDYKEGRPRKYTDEELQKAIELLSSHTLRDVEKITGISYSTIRRAMKRLGELESSNYIYTYS